MKKCIVHAEVFFSLFIASMLPSTVFSQHTLKGQVSNESTGEMIAGAVVSVENSFASAVTDATGNFIIANLKNEHAKIHISHISYEPYETEWKSSENTLNIRLTRRIILADEVNIIATRAGDHSAMAITSVSKEDLEKQNLGQDLPYLLNLTPSVVVTSDAGAGVGYTGIRIRGSDPTRVNVTINGIPVNDAEGHLVYWVDLPDFSSSVDNIQIQRGIGTSTNGAGAFGGSVNIQSTRLSPKPFATLSGSYGSFSTVKNTVQFGTGLIQNKFSFDGRLSKITSNGYIDRASSDLKSFYLSGGFYGSNSSLRMIIFSGKEKTYQAWYGVPEDSLKTNRKYNPAGQYYDADGNAHYYNNQTDNYQQDYYQLLYSKSLNTSWNLNLALHYTKGKGYYEEFVQDGQRGNYNLDTVFTGIDTVTNTNLIRQRWLDNDFYGFTFSSNYRKKNLQFTFGGAGNQYKGKHFDEIIWMEKNSGTPFPYRYSDNDATKNDLNLYAKTSYDFTDRLNVFLDLQWRTISYSFPGFTTNLENAQQKVNLDFINPKAGISFDLKAGHKIYASMSVGNKEPVRDDYVNSSPLSRPQPESMYDIEAGYKLRKENLLISANYYFMNYTDQLILTGKINDVGAYIRENVSKSYRTGIEVEFAYNISKRINVSGNATFSSNKINEYPEYVDDYDNGIQILNIYKKTDIAFSPAVVSAGKFEYIPFKNIRADFISKYVSRQYLDNTSNEKRQLKAYSISDVLLNYTWKNSHAGEIGITFCIKNIFDNLYESNGYTYSYRSGGELVTQNFYYPQAGINWMGGISLKF